MVKSTVSAIIKSVDVYMIPVKPQTVVYDASFVLKRMGRVIVRVVTDDGIEGYGVTFAEPVGEYIKTILREEVVGRSALANEDIWGAMFSSIRSSGRKGLALLAMSAIDIAIWDIRGKMLMQPVYRLLGGVKNRVPAYASVGFLSMPDDEVAEKAVACVADGYQTIKIKIGYDGGRNIGADVRRVERVRSAVGDSVDIIIDANGIYDAATAIRLARLLTDYNVSLFEEPTHADDIEGLRRVREAGNIPIGSGENEYTKYGCRDLVLAQAVDVVQCDITRAGGVTEMLKISAIAEAWNLKLAPHFWPEYSAHLVSAAPHGLFVEVFPKNLGLAPAHRAIVNEPVIREGHYEIGDGPGFGMEYDYEYLVRHRLG